MMHGPCGILNPSYICMQDGKCTKKFPKDLTQQTELNVNGYQLYRRRVLVEKKEHRALIIDITTPDQHAIYFTDPEHAAHRNNNSMLMASFTLIQREHNVHQYLYQDIPELYTFNRSTKQWQQRKRRAPKRVIGRIYNVLPSDAERFALRLILLHRKGPTSFEDIRTVDGVTHDTLKNAARAISLLEDDAEHRCFLQDAAIINMPAQIRQLFATLILFQTPNDIHALFTEFQQDMADDYIRHDELKDPNATFQQQHIHMCLGEIQKNLNIHGKSLQDFPEMPQLPAAYAQPQQANDEINIEQEREQGQQRLQQLNPEQLHIHNTVVQTIETQSADNCFFLDGPAGTGKTFLYNTLVQNLQASGHKVKCVAYSGIAATLLIHSRTAHSTFQIPIPLLVNSTCNVKAQSLRAQQLQDTTLFAWDKASMIPATALKAVDHLLKDITKVQKPFGGKYFMLGSDLYKYCQSSRMRAENEWCKNASSHEKSRMCGLSSNNSDSLQTRELFKMRLTKHSQTGFSE
eukprot:gene1007-biopygen253